MTEPHILVRDLSKTYRVPVREAGLRASIQSLWSRVYRNVEAVKDISFSIARSEIVGFLGPNGAGKTTTLKMLSGLLYPSSGEVHVAGFLPWKRDYDYLRRISMVMGNKGQMIWDVPPKDSFHILGVIYRISTAELKQTLDELVDLLDMESLLSKPVRTLSLGERMKCELVAALLYKPEILFLDEPTLGLDVAMQARLRRFIAEYNHRTGATIILTSHYMADVEALCSRIIMINHGCLVYDGGLQDLARQLAPYKLVRLVLSDEYTSADGQLPLPDGVDIVEQENSLWTLRVRQNEITMVTAFLLSTFPVVDLSIEQPSIESVIELVYQGGAL